MYTEILSDLPRKKLNIWTSFLADASLKAEDIPEKTVLVWDGDKLIATGSRVGNVLKYIAVDEKRQGENLAATVVSELRQDAFREGTEHLFIYTKPKNETVFLPLFFYTVARTEDVLLMESRKDGIKSYLNSLPQKREGISGAVVANCNPFTLGHRYLIEKASKECDTLYVFALSEDKSFFSAEDRLTMVKAGTENIPNVIVVPTGPYLVSSATFPTYFLKDRTDEAKCGLDIEIFSALIAPRLGITKRFVGTEPSCPLTRKYNEALKKSLPLYNIETVEIPRLECEGIPVSASHVRSLIKEGKSTEIKKFVPYNIYEFITRGR